MTPAILNPRHPTDQHLAYLCSEKRRETTRAGKLRADVPVKLARERYESSDAARGETAPLAADAEDQAAMEQTERQLEGKGRGKKK